MTAGRAADRASPDQTVAKLLRLYPAGSTLPSLAETQTGDLYILKLSGAGPGAEALLTDFLGTSLAGRLGLDVPVTRPLYLPANFPWQIGTDEFDDLVRRSPGWNLGLGYLPDTRDLTAADLDDIPLPISADLALADRLLQNVDRTRANPNLLAGRTGAIWAIDHGTCLFLRRIVADRRPFPFALPRNHFLAGATLSFPGRADPANIDPGFVQALVAAAPQSWLDTLPIGRADLIGRIAQYVEAFRTAIERNP